MKQDPAFVTWLTAETNVESDLQWELAVARHLALAIKGSVKRFDALIRLRSLGIEGTASNLPDHPSANRRRHEELFGGAVVPAPAGVADVK